MPILSVFVFVVGLAPLALAQDYRVVMKDTGRIVSGRFVSEDDSSVVIQVGGVETRFRKSRLDTEKMKQLNRDAPRPAQSTGAAGVPSKATTGPFSVYETPEFRAAAKDEVFHRQANIARLKRVLAEWEAKPDYPNKARDMQGIKATILQQEKELEDIKLDLGESNDAEATRLRARMIELVRAADREHREYFEALHRKASQDELDSRLKTFQRLNREAGEASEAFTRYMKSRK